MFTASIIRDMMEAPSSISLDNIAYAVETVCLKSLPATAMQVTRGRGIKMNSYSLLTSALDGGEWSASGLAALYPRERTPLPI
jgi:hypothetical protein